MTEIDLSKEINEFDSKNNYCKAYSNNVEKLILILEGVFQSDKKYDVENFTVQLARTIDFFCSIDSSQYFLQMKGLYTYFSRTYHKIDYTMINFQHLYCEMIYKKLEKLMTNVSKILELFGNESNEYTYSFVEMFIVILSNVSNDFDKRQGSGIYDAIAPFCAELAQTYISLDLFLNERFCDTASRK